MNRPPTLGATTVPPRKPLKHAGRLTNRINGPIIPKPRRRKP